MILKILKFCVVGFSGMAVDFTVTFLLKEKVKLHRYFANAMGFTTAASSNFLLNRNWTFAITGDGLYYQYFLFIIFSIIGLGINTMFIYIFERREIGFYGSKFLAILITTVWNFGISYLVTFR